MCTTRGKGRPSWGRGLSRGRTSRGNCRLGGGGRVGGGAVALCDRSSMAALMGVRTPSRAVHVGMVWTACCMLPNWVVMVSC